MKPQTNNEQCNSEETTGYLSTLKQHGNTPGQAQRDALQYVQKHQQHDAAQITTYAAIITCL